jgi:uncharacterized protein
LTDDSDSNSSNEIQEERAHVPEADSPNPLTPAPAPRKPTWGRPERNRLIMWVVIAFLAPVPLVSVLQRLYGSGLAVLAVPNELPGRWISAFFVILATWFVARKEKRPLDDYGIPPSQALGKRFWEGALWGFAALSTIVLILFVTGHFRFDSVALHGVAALRYALGWAAVFLAVGMAEEFGFRGYVLFIAAKRLSFWKGAVIVSIGFAVAHLGNHGENILGIFQVFIISMLFCLTLRRTGNLWFAVGFHAFWDWAQTFFYGTPDSGLLGVGRFLNTSVGGPSWFTGGSAGPEGSLIAVLIIALCFALVHLRFPNVIHSDRPA